MSEWLGWWPEKKDDERPGMKGWGYEWDKGRNERIGDGRVVARTE